MVGTNQISSELVTSLHKGAPLADRQLQLKPGQILSGKVLELYPNQRASILLGNQQLTAQLQAPLNLHENYWFQVQSVDKLLRLKVIADKATNKRTQGIDVLLKSIGLKNNKNNAAFLMELFDEKIPFDKENIKDAVHLLEKQSNKKMAQSTLIEMIKHKLPITQSVFNALLMKSSTSLTEQISTVLSALSNENDLTSAALQLRQQLQLINNENTNHNIIETIASSAAKGETSFFQLLKVAGEIPSSTQFDQWKGSWTNWTNKSDFKPPFGVDESKLIDALQQLKMKQLHLSQPEHSQLVKFINQSELALNGADSMQVNRLKNLFLSTANLQRIYSKLPSSYQSLLTKWLDEPTKNNLQQMLTPLKQLVDKQLNSEMDKNMTELLVKSELGQLQVAKNPRDHFITQLKHFLYFSGSQYENDFLTSLMNQKNLNEQNSLKSTLIQVMQEGNLNNTKAIESLIHLLNGVQLTSVQENNTMMLVNFQLPGGSFGLTKDLQISFESQKDKSNQINPDYCHILFYLQLEKLGDTVIDMQIQKRMVTITVVNDKPQAEQILSQLKPTLNEGLKQLDYQLSSVQFRSNTPEKKAIDTSPSNNYDKEQPLSRGVDYKI
ncbi:hypothetical protein [Aquibacillus saliphilus]|uniref:hypothetical protein n=1 Tax=Aquibacillus saliphilus TaxID=1909422 RepID=UPI001CEFFF47|nr:hypothetical protein [Aquibacillus saliphilus]